MESPRATDLGITYVTDSMKSYNLNLMGLTVSQLHHYSWGGIIGLGGGLIIDSNGAGVGPTSLFAYEIVRARGVVTHTVH